MDRLTRIFAFFLIFSCASTAGAKSILAHPYIGLDFKQIWTRGQSDYKYLVANDYPGFNVYLGSAFDQVWGIELGYELTRKEKKDYSFDAGTRFFGADASGVSSTIKARFTQWYADWRGILPATNQIDLSASLGIGFIKPKLTISVNDVGGIGVDEVLEGIKVDNRAIWRLGLGASYMLTDRLSFRGNMRWEGYDRIRLRADFSGLEGEPSRPFRSAMTVSLGFLLHF